MNEFVKLRNFVHVIARALRKRCALSRSSLDVIKKALVVVAVVFLGVTMLSVAHAVTISDVPLVVNIVGPGAQITWTTNEPSTSYVHYGTSAGSLASYSTSRCDAGGDVVSHCVNLTGLLPNTSYYFKAISCASGDASGVACGELYGSPFTTGSGGGTENVGTIPAVPSNFRVSGTGSASAVYLAWDDVSGEDKYNVERAQSGDLNLTWTALFQTGASVTTYMDTTASPGTSYDYRVQACLSGYGCSAYAYVSNVTVAPLPDSAPPTAPANLSATGASTSQVNLSWTASTDNVGVLGYKIFRGNLFLTTVTATSYSDSSGLSPGTTYFYTVKAVDTSALESPASSPAGATTFTGGQGGTTSDAEAPSTPTGLVATKDSYNEVDLSWTQSSDNVGVLGYVIYRSTNALWTTLGHSSVATYIDATVSSSAPYYYAVKAYDAAGNMSATSTALFLNTPAASSGNTTTTTTQTSIGTTPTGSIPSAPSNVRLNGSFIASQISLLWDDNAWSEDKWNIERKLTTGNSYSLLAQILGANTTSYADTTASPGTSYDYRVQACLSGYGCSAYAYLTGVGMPLVTVSTTSIVYTNEATTTGFYGQTTSGKEYVLWNAGGGATSSDSVTLATLTGTTSGESTGVSVSVLLGDSYCDGSIGKTPLTFSVTPYGRAFLKFSMVSPTAATTILANGTYPIQNGVYHWEAVAYSGHTLSGKTSGGFTLNQTCRSAIGAASAVANKMAETGNRTDVLPAPQSNVRPSDERGSTEAERPNVRPSEKREGAGAGRSNVRGSGATTVSPIPFRLDDSVRMTDTTSASSFDEATTSGKEYALRAVGEITASNIATSEEYARYCDLPAHEVECQTYAITKVVTKEVVAAAPPISHDTFVAIESKGESLPGGATNEKELQSACAQTRYATDCADIFVASGVSDRETADKVVEQSLAQNAEIEKVFTNRVGARNFSDGDGDDIADYDEVNIYHTDPHNFDTNGNGISDGAEILAGTDPLAKVSTPVATGVLPEGRTPGEPLQATSTATSAASVLPSLPQQKIIYEDPKFAGDAKPKLLAVTAVVAATVSTPEKATTTKIKLSGKALPNSFITLFIYSEPIVVTVKTDESGAWTYTLDKELSDGTHEVYSAITDTGGRILAKSEPLPFVKEAAAVSFGSPALLPSSSQAAPGFFSGGSLYALIVVLIGVLGLAFVLIGIVTQRHATPILPNADTKKE